MAATPCHEHVAFRGTPWEATALGVTVWSMGNCTHWLRDIHGADHSAHLALLTARRQPKVAGLGTSLI